MKEIPEFNKATKKKPKVLVAPLDWGLGHATRCIPLITALLQAGCEVIVAAAKDQQTLLQQAFPSLRHVLLKGYDVRFGKNTWKTQLGIILQIPKILIRIKLENRWLKRFQRTEQLDAVISDNRYGLHTGGVYSVFITHQLTIRTPFGKRADNALRRLNYRLINAFNVCWVPDVDGEDNLAGDLSHPVVLPVVPVRYIGLLSRFRKLAVDRSADLLVLLSGPEPQRSIFEKRVLQQLAKHPGKASLLRGLPNGGSLPTLPANVQAFNHLPAPELNELFCNSAYIISRSGYSTIMDLVASGARGILVPTPGQTEQQYLANRLSARNQTYCVNQDDFNLEEALKQAGQFAFPDVRDADEHLLKAAIGSLLGRLA